MRRGGPIALLGVLALPGAAHAHGLMVYVSTPVSPPLVFLPWAVAGILALLICNARWFRRAGVRPRGRLDDPTTGIVAFILLFGLIGIFAASANTAPPPGLGLPSAAFWGLGWSEVGDLFVEWNLLGIGVLCGSLLIFGGLARAPAKAIAQVLTHNAALYLILLLPYILTGALTHGEAGAYVRDNCRRQVRELTKASVQYALDHEGRLPAAKSWDELFPRIAPYLEEPRVGRYSTAWVCPWKAARHRRPAPYEWNAALAGKRLSINMRNEWLVRCDAHPDFLPSDVWIAIEEIEMDQDRVIGLPAAETELPQPPRE